MSSRRGRALLPSLLLLAAASATPVVGGCATRAHEMTRNLVEGNDAALKGDFPSAISYYEKALANVPDSDAAKRNLGIVLVKVGNYRRARDMLQAVTKAYPADVEVFYFLGEAQRGLQSFNEATTSYQRALRIDGNDMRAQKALAWTWYKTGQNDRSLMLMQPLLRASPGDLQVRLIVASALNKRKRFSEAAETLSPVEKSGFTIRGRDKMSAESERALLMTALADASYGLENYAKAAALYTEVLKTRPFLATALVGSAKCDIRSSLNQRALAKLARAVKADPNSPEAHFLLARLNEKVDASKALFYHKRFLLLAQDRSEFGDAVAVSRQAVARIERKTAER